MTTHMAVGLMAELPQLHVIVEWTQEEATVTGDRPPEAATVVVSVQGQNGEVVREETQHATPLGIAPSSFLLDLVVVSALRWHWQRMTAGIEAATEPGMVFEEAAKEAIEWKGSTHHK
ncbi:hypothetical protein [Streptomyces buecherae]|uniref:hypothetical protein n=1 Tax=Streptomyces buecherae TaxID=2763006 RepID=UPI00164E5CFE|nr:hypothetical protein [Streptomyces buecherae]QNJ42010.1 hypothetical protein H7H31_21250 [Streptomyces buecherae]